MFGFDLATVLVAVVSGLIGGFLGGWVTAFRLGRWRQSVEDKLEIHDGRLEQIGRCLSNGALRFEEMKVVQALQKAMNEKLGEIAKDLKGFRESSDKKLQRLENQIVAIDTRCQETHKRSR